jgi:hypothetical protein
MAIVAHPHPLLGGNAEHKVPLILAKGLRNDGWITARPNFRGAGATEGPHADGEGEAEDLEAVASRLSSTFPGLPLVLCARAEIVPEQVRRHRQGMPGIRRAHKAAPRLQTLAPHQPAYPIGD